MPRYIRTKRFITAFKKWMRIENNYLIIGGAKHKIIKQADTIEELCDVSDLLIVSDGINKMAIYIESSDYTKCWFRTHDIYTVYEFYVKAGNDYKCVATKNEKGELELL